MKKGYSPKELLAAGPQRSFTGAALAQIVFPIGGIGAGSIGLTGRGSIRDWEIFNRPNFGSRLYDTFPMIWAKEKGGKPVTRILQGPLLPPYNEDGCGQPHCNAEGLPHMDSCTFRGEYPFAHIDFQSKKLPVKVSLEAYNPFIPSNADDSGFPAAIFRYTLTNTAKNPVQSTVVWCQQNPVGSIGEAVHHGWLDGIEYGVGQNVNEYVEEGALRGLNFTSKKWAKDHPRFGSMALMTPDKNITYSTHRSREGWFTARHDIWDAFSVTGKLPQHNYGPSDEGATDTGMLGVCVTLKPGESKTVTFYLTWYFPTYEKYWQNIGLVMGEKCCGEKAARKPTWKNYYASQFSSAVDVASKLHAKHKMLYAETKAFHDALFSSTLPPYVLDAVSSQMAIIKTATCLRLTDGTFYGFEGCSPVRGCCEGSCTHVWNYQQAVPFLFPEMERSMRVADYTYNFRSDDGMCFRLQLPIGTDPDNFHACADGQMGGIIKVYRDWKICGDDNWLRHLWPKVKRALEFAWKKWDPDKDGVMDTVQHNTYDIEFLGANALTACFYLGALVAGAEMADYLGETEKAEEYRAVYEKGRAWTDANLFNGEFYYQKYEPKKEEYYQFGRGCLADAVLGQWITSLVGLGHILDPAKIKKTLKSIFKYNWLSDMTEHENVQRLYAINDDAGLLLCSWPKGGRPAVPFPYSDEVWTGIEYQVASHCIMEGLLTEGLTITKAVRDRHDGIKRNPWDEYECGHHYARAMSSYGLLLALSGFTFNKGDGTVGFNPQVNKEDFRTFWSLDGVWGTYAQKGRKATISVLYGSIALSRLDLPSFAGQKKVKLTVGNKTIKGQLDSYGSITFERTLALKAGQELQIQF